MVYMAYEVLAKCNHLVLGGQNEDGNLEWIGTKEEWAEANREETNAIWK